MPDLSDPRLVPDEFWERLRSEVVRRNPGLRLANSPGGTVPPRKGLHRLIGAANGRGWEVAFYPGRLLAPESIVGFTTAVRLVAFDRTLEETAPWYYAGPRPRAFSRPFLDFDRIIMRYRRREGNLTGAITHDAAFDRRWAVYPFDGVLGEALRDPRFRRMFDTSASIGPRRAESPTIAIFGTDATLSVTVELRRDAATAVSSLIEEFSAFLDRLETLRGLPSASQAPIPFDYLPDESDLDYPVPRIRCPTCGVNSHPRFMTRVETQVCDKCGKSIYRMT